MSGAAGKPIKGSLASGRFAIIPARAIDDRRLSKAALIVLMMLGTYSDKNGWCWPSVPTLAARRGLTERHVQHALAELEALGYVETKPTFNPRGRQSASRRRILFDPLPATDDGRASESENMSPGVNSSFTPGGEAHLHPGVNSSFTPVSTERPIERSSAREGSGTLGNKSKPDQRSSANVVPYRIERRSGTAACSARGDDTTTERAWATARPRLVSELGEAIVQSWLDGLVPIELGPKVWRLRAKTNFKSSEINQRYGPRIGDCLGRKFIVEPPSARGDTVSPLAAAR